ncbi:MAG: GFA family protein [Sphingomonadaceae bacterium]|nr:GFA family protein [Sphingomonadaceae bacterium]
MSEAASTVVTGGCHCDAVRFEALVREMRPEVLDCNCSICAKTGFLHLIVAHDDFELLSGRDALTSYRFGSGTAEHLFCKHCGIKSFYQPRSHPDAWSVNLRALDEEHGLEVDVEPFDGRDWEKAKAGL